jgi:quinol monooxygenase YgiN
LRGSARAGNEGAVADALRDVLAPSREESGCLDEAAFDHHAGLPHTRRFIERVVALIDHPLDITRAEQIG